MGTTRSPSPQLLLLGLRKKMWAQVMSNQVGGVSKFDGFD
jgi:hypothetical protein